MVDNQVWSVMISKTCEAFGGNMIGMYMAFGDDDVIVIAELPACFCCSDFLVTVEQEVCSM